MPRNSSVKSTTYAADLWYGQSEAMAFGGAFLLPDTDATVDFEWGATYSPRDERAGGDFGGNGLVATAETQNPELAAAFLDHVTGADAMREFCAGASLLPTRADLSQVFVDQATTVRPEDSAQVASPDMASIITVLQDQLERVFVGGQDTETTVRRLAEGIAEATAG